ncbi:MAG: IS110 family transposase [Vallitaleaceae bacterium]|nr:IS110 family transposase [Vallitaleaceae bacterium]
MESTKEKAIDFRIVQNLQAQNREVLRYGFEFDVHKHKIVVCVKAQLATGELVEIKCLNFHATNLGLEELMNFLGKYRPVANFLMECTGVYHLPLYYALQRHFPDESQRIVAMNPLLLNRKLTDLNSHNDKVDARKLANLSFYTELLKPSYIGSMNFYHTRDYIRSYHKSRVQLTRLRARLIRILDSLNIKIKFDFSREWTLKLLDHYISQNWTLLEAYESLLKHWISQGKAISVLEKQRKDIERDGNARIPPNARQLLRTDLARYLHEDLVSFSFLEGAEQLVLEDEDLKEAYASVIQLPGMGSVGALTVVLELGNFRRFPNWRALAKFCGVVPLGYESGETKWRGHINRFSNKFLRTTLYQAAGILINRTARNTDLAEFAFYQYHKRGLPFKKAAIKVAQKLARTIFSILVLQIPYDPNYERKMRKEQQIRKQLDRKHSLLESPRTRAVRRQMQDFLVTNYDFLNSTSKYHLKQGFTRVLNRVKFENDHREIKERKKKKEESL